MDKLTFGMEDNAFKVKQGLDYEVIDSDSRVREVANLLAKERVLGLDTENTGLDPHQDKPLLLQIGTRHKCFIFPAYLGLDLSPLVPILESELIVKIMHNAQYDWKFVAKHYGAEMLNIYCSLVAERVLTVGIPGGKVFPSFADCALKYLGMVVDKTIRSAFINRDPIKNPITENEFRYSANDTLCLFEFYDAQLKQAVELEMLGLFRLEFDALPASSDMELAGFLIDKTKWMRLVAKAVKREKEEAAAILKMFDGVVAQPNLWGLPTFNINSTAQLLENLERLGYRLDDTESDTLKKYKHEHPVFDLLLKQREDKKVISTYGAKFVAEINKATGRIHPNFNQVRAATGRYSSSHPNAQNIPAFKEDDPRSFDFRSCIVAGPNKKLVTADYSQQELRIIAAESGDPVFKKAYTQKDENGNYLDAHSYTASLMFNIPYDQIDKKGPERRKAKALGFLLAYGGGPAALAESLGLKGKRGVKQAKKLMEAYFSHYPGIESYLNNLSKIGRARLWSTTVAGRRRNYVLPPMESEDYDQQVASIERQAKNSPIQGSAADVTKKAIAILHRKLKEAELSARILMIVHDEIVTEVEETQAPLCARLVEESMIEGWDYFYKTIPMLVDAVISDHWQK